MSGAFAPDKSEPMNKKYLAVSVLLIALLLPAAVFAAVDYSEPGTVSGTDALKTIMNGIITFVWQFFVGLSVIMFIVAGIQFLSSNGDPAKITSARNAFIWGVVGIIVAIVAFSIVTIIRGVVK